MKARIFERASEVNLSRRTLLRGSAGIIGGSLLPAMPAFAEDQPPIGTWPAGVSGSSVFIGIRVPRTGTYAVQGEDELKGYQLADRAHQRRPRADQEDLAEDQQGRARQGS